VLYLSRLLLDPASPRALGDLVSAYEMHRTVMRAFPDHQSDNRVLFRVDASAHSGRPQVLVQALQRADWSWLDETPGYLWQDEHWHFPNPEQKAVALAPAGGAVLAFRLRANPTFRRGRRRLAWLRREEQIRWLVRQGAHGGFEPLRLTVTQEGRVWTRKRSGSGTASLCFGSVLFAGLLRVTCPRSLVEAVRRGIGSGKAFGFGLLSLARPD
jgi:CRISPR system Cascade subunit CasE